MTDLQIGASDGEGFQVACGARAGEGPSGGGAPVAGLDALRPRLLHACNATRTLQALLVTQLQTLQSLAELSAICSRLMPRYRQEGNPFLHHRNENLSKA